MAFLSIGLFLISASLAAITNNFDCAKLSSSDCEQIGYCYWDATSAGECKKDDCLGIATSNASSAGCAAGCNVATFEDNGFSGPYDQCGTQKYLFVCTRRSTSYVSPVEDYDIDDCFAGMVLSDGVCSKDDGGDVGRCINVTGTYDNVAGGTFTGVVCADDVDYSCKQIGTANCQMQAGCAIVNNDCIRDTCYGLSDTACTTALGCNNFTVYQYTTPGDVYTISTTTICGKASDKYGSVQTPNPCYGLSTRISYYSEDPCSGWITGSPLPANTAHCTVSQGDDCGTPDCDSSCSENADERCTAATGISGVTCVVKSATLDGETGRYCTDGREYVTDGSRAVRTPTLVAILLAAVLLAVFAQ